MINFIRTMHSVSESDLEKVEQAFGFTFPDDFRAHYLVHNGGRPQNNLFKKNNSVFVISEFFPIKYGNRDCLFEDVFRDLKIGQAHIPKYLIPFADDPVGDYYCFSVRDKDKGSIWIFRGEFSDEPKRAVEFLAMSLTIFLESMVADKV